MADQEWVELCQVTTETEKELIRSALEPYDIRMIFRSLLLSSVYPGLSPIKLLVRTWNWHAESLLKTRRSPESKHTGVDIGEG